MACSEKINILFLTNSWNIGGIEQNILDYLDSMNKEHFNCFVGSLKPGDMFKHEVCKRKIQFTHFRGILSLLTFLKKNRIDIVQLYGLRTNVFARSVSKLAGCKVISTIMSVDSWRKWYHVMMDRSTFSWVDVWISNSEAGKKVFIEREKIAPAKIKVVHNGINLSKYQQLKRREISNLKEKYGLSEDCIVIGEVANLREAKGHMDIIEAIPEIIQQYPKARFFFAGEDLSDGEVKKYAKTKDVDRYIVFAGYCDNIPELLPMFDIFILPSLWEGLPTAIIEAMAVGLPIIASDVGGIPELINDKENGLLIKPRSPEQLASSILYLLENRDIMRLMGDRNIIRAKQNHDIKIKAKGFEDIYISLLKENY